MPLLEPNKSDIFILLRNLLSIDSNRKPYKKIYLSFGSKFNEKKVIYALSSIPDHNTNAPFQMLPAFLRDYDLDDRILSICIDDFSNPANKEANRNILASVIQDNIDMVLVDWKIVAVELTVFLCRYIKLLNEFKIEPHRVYCALYFQYINPNTIEEQFADKTLDITREVFKTSLYRNSVYVWHGYNPNLYNCLCPVYYSLVNYCRNVSIIRQKFGYKPISSFEIEHWLSTLETTNKIELRSFMANCFDITQYSNDGNFWPLFRFADIAGEE